MKIMLWTYPTIDTVNSLLLEYNYTIKYLFSLIPVSRHFYYEWLKNDSYGRFHSYATLIEACKKLDVNNKFDWSYPSVQEAVDYLRENRPPTSYMARCTQLKLIKGCDISVGSYQRLVKWHNLCEQGLAFPSLHMHKPTYTF